MTEKGQKVRELFLVHIKAATKKGSLKVMLGDGTVSDQESFDPSHVRQFYDCILRNLLNWKSEGVSVTIDQDLRRIFIKLETKEDNYLLSCNMSLQYHSLRSEEHTSELQSRPHLVCRLLLEKKKRNYKYYRLIKL